MNEANTTTNKNVEEKKHVEQSLTVDVFVEEEEEIQRPWWILPAIVVSQFAGTALWFAGNAVLEDLVKEWGLDESSLSYLTSSVQFGFIVGTLVFAVWNVADRFPPTRVFLSCALLGALTNAVIPAIPHTAPLVVWRFLTGFSLAGIYPVGMKVAADWFGGGLGRALGWLVGALAVGSAFPFLLKQIPQPYQALLWETSFLAACGGIVVGCLVPNGPYRKAGTKWDPSVLYTLFESPAFRGAAFGYFGHMWELYAFWTWCPVVWEAYLEGRDNTVWDAGVITFCVLAIGGLGCVLGGLASQRYGSAAVAFVCLSVSGVMCLVSPLLFWTPPAVALCAYLVWGLAVVGDSPQFSSLVAQTVPSQNKGTALTIVNCIGFTITIGSIQLLGVPLDERYLFLLLAPGPAFGLYSMRNLVFDSSSGDVATEKETTNRHQEHQDDEEVGNP